MKIKSAYKSIKSLKHVVLVLLVTVSTFVANVGQAQNIAASGTDAKAVTIPQDNPSWCDKIFGLGKLYRNDKNWFIEESTFARDACNSTTTM